MDEKVRENRLRRMAERQRLMLRKSRRRDPRARDYRKYWLLKQDNLEVVAGDEWGIDLEEVEEWLGANSSRDHDTAEWKEFERLVGRI